MNLDLRSETVEAKPRKLDCAWSLEVFLPEVFYYEPPTPGEVWMRRLRELLRRAGRVLYGILLRPLPSGVWEDVETLTTA